MQEAPEREGDTMAIEEIMAKYEAEANRPVEAPKGPGGFLITLCDVLCGTAWWFTFWMI